MHGPKPTRGFPGCGPCLRLLLVAHEHAESRRHRSIPTPKSHPSTDANKYRSVRDARDWQNPYLMEQVNGIDARPISAAAKAPTLSPGEVVAYLERLPLIAWPCGLVVAVQENDVRAPGDGARIKRNSEELVRLLEKADVKLDLWPSA
jgi:hypothetical protein